MKRGSTHVHWKESVANVDTAEGVGGGQEG